MKLRLWLLFFTLPFSLAMHAQDVNALLEKVKAKLAIVNDYSATGQLKQTLLF